MTDESWSMVEQAVFRLFDEISGEHTAIGARLAEMGWSDIEAEYPVETAELLFRAQGRSLAHTDCLDRVMLAELAPVLDGPADAVLLPNVADGCMPGSGPDSVSGIVLGQLQGRVVVPVAGALGAVSVAVRDAADLQGRRLDTFDPTVYWTAVTGPQSAPQIKATAEWKRAMATAHRALGSELVALSAQLLQIAVDHAKDRAQFGAPIGSFQSPRHALAEACAAVEGARALLDEAWRFGGDQLALSAKAAAGRAHRLVANTTMQVCAAIGLTAEHDLHRYVRRGLQIDALCGSSSQLESLLAEQLLHPGATEQALPTILVCG